MTTAQSGPSAAAVAAVRAATSTQPGMTSTQPGMTSTQPGMTSTQPGMTSTQPGMTSTQPGKPTITMPGGGGKLSFAEFEQAAKKLKILLDNGIISQEEFAAEKQRLVANMEI